MDLAHALAERHRTSALPIPLCADELKARLEDAGMAMLGLKVRHLRPAEMQSCMPQVVHDAIEAYGWTEEEMPFPIPSARRITEMDCAYGWLRLIPLDRAPKGSGLMASPHGGAVLRQICWAKSFLNPHTGRPLFSDRKIAEKLHCSHKTVAAWHAKALDIILGQLWRRGPPIE